MKFAIRLYPIGTENVLVKKDFSVDVISSVILDKDFAQKIAVQMEKRYICSSRLISDEDGRNCIVVYGLNGRLLGNMYLRKDHCYEMLCDENGEILS